MHSGAAAVSLLADTPGFHSSCILPEMMHCGPLGVHLECGACALLELCRCGHFGDGNGHTEWKPRLDAQLAEAYDQFGRWCRRRHVTHSQGLFKHTTLGMHQKFSVPKLKVKAHTSLLVIDWLAKVCCDRVANVSADEYEVDRASILWGLSEMFHIWRTAGTWLTRSQLRDLRIARDACFFASWKMCVLHEETETFLYKLLPKHHLIDHAERSCQQTEWNPCSCWTFSDEDNMGFMSGIFQACHATTINSAGIERWLLQFCDELKTRFGN